jgi:hypothetical protein
MKKVEKLHEFRLATVDDIDAIMAFYKAEWSDTHILANDRDFFCYQHAVGDRVNFLLAINRETGAIEGAEGFIQYSEKLCDVGAVMWKTSASCKVPFLGVEVVRRLKEAKGCRVYLGPGANPRTAVPLHGKMLKHNVGKLEHFYMLSDLPDYKIAVVKDKKFAPCNTEQSGFTLQQVAAIEELDGKFPYEAWFDRKPFKDRWYVNRRYFTYPIYSYRCFAVTDSNGKVPAVLFAREVSQNGATVLRIVDIIGDTGCISQLQQELAALIDKNGYEYIDIYCKGIGSNALRQGGFLHKDAQDPNILPNYFEPFLQQNVDIWYSLSDDDAVLFKADGDQDRPNRRA